MFRSRIARESHESFDWGSSACQRPVDQTLLTDVEWIPRIDLIQLSTCR